MKKSFIALAAFVLGVAISSCQVQTCPTYSKKDLKENRPSAERDINA